MLKLGLDIHREKFVVAAQYDHATPRPPRGFAPAEFVPWVEARLREGFEVHVVYESAGWGLQSPYGARKTGATTQSVTAKCYSASPLAPAACAVSG